MGTYRVKPKDGKWKVSKGNRTISSHRKKSRAKQSARQKASSGDQIIIHRKNGTIQSQTGVR